MESQTKTWISNPRTSLALKFDSEDPTSGSGEQDDLPEEADPKSNQERINHQYTTEIPESILAEAQKATNTNNNNNNRERRLILHPQRRGIRPEPPKVHISHPQASRDERMAVVRSHSRQRRSDFPSEVRTRSISSPGSPQASIY